MDSEVLVRLTLEEALILQQLMSKVAIDIRKDEGKKDQEKKAEERDLPSELMKISLKVQYGLLESFVGGEV